MGKIKIDIEETTIKNRITFSNDKFVPCLAL